MTYSTDEDYLGGGGIWNTLPWSGKAGGNFCNTFSGLLMSFMIMMTAHPHLNKTTTCKGWLIFIPSQNFTFVRSDEIKQYQKLFRTFMKLLNHALIVHRLSYMSEHRVI